MCDTRPETFRTEISKQVWILIQQNKGMRTEVFNFPTVPVSFESREKRQKEENNTT